MNSDRVSHRVLSYLGLNDDYRPSPETEPVEFLAKHIRELPPNLLTAFSELTTPKQRSILAIRNRRTKYCSSRNPPELAFDAARTTWPTLWHDRGHDRGMQQQEGDAEKQWVEDSFLPGLPKHVGKLASLLGGFEENREAERLRTMRRQQAHDEFVPEEEDSDGDEIPVAEAESEAELKADFVRRVKERFIYGLLENMDYDKVDWDESLDGDSDREIQDRWFDEDD